MKVPKLVPVLLLLLFTLQGCYAFKWKPANLTDKQLEELIKNDKPDEVRVSFWDLPLWIKIHYVLTVILGILGVWKFLPIVVTKIKSALDNSRRRKILRCIFENPGISLRDLEKLTNMNRSTIRYHLDFLEKEGLSYSIRIGKHRLFFPCNSNVELDRIVKSKRKRQIIELLNGNGNLTIRDIAENLGVSYHTAYRHIVDLERVGIVTVSNGSVKLRRRA